MVVIRNSANSVSNDRLGLKQYDKAEYMFYQAIYRIPHKLYPYYLLMKMYIESNQIKKATEIAKIIIRKKLKVESIHTNKMKKEA